MTYLRAPVRSLAAQSSGRQSLKDQSSTDPSLKGGASEGGASGDGASGDGLSAGLRDQAIAALVPFFLDAPTGDAAAARAVARNVLEDYNAATDTELQLATETIALGFASLACLSAAMVVKDKSLPEMLRLQGYALALDRGSQKAAKALNAQRAERAMNPSIKRENTAWDDDAFRRTIREALEKMTEANAKLAGFIAALPPVKQKPKPKLVLHSPEPMTRAVLARRARG